MRKGKRIRVSLVFNLWLKQKAIHWQTTALRCVTFRRDFPKEKWATIENEFKDF